MKRLSLAAVLVLILFSTDFAQTLTLGPNVGYVKSKDADKGTYIFGAAARFNVMVFGVEGTIHYYEQKYFNDAVKVQNYPISVTGMFYPLPFIYAGVGLDWFNSKTTVEFPGIPSQSSTDQQIGYHFGAGVQISLGGVTLTGDYRYVLMGKMKVPSSSEVDNSSTIIAIGLLFKIF